MSVNVKVIGARAVVKLDPTEKKTLGGIILATSQEDRATKGTVVSIGSGMKAKDGTIIPMDIQVGDVVVFSETAGAPIAIDGEEGEYLVINEREILAIVG